MRTEGKWIVDETGACVRLDISALEARPLIADCENLYNGLSDEEQKANAEFICKAVNLQCQDIVKYIPDAIQVYQNEFPTSFDGVDMAIVLGKIEAILAEVEEK
jgi:hypothetical protein